MSRRKISTMTADQKDDLHRLYQNEWWTAGRDREEIDTVLEGSDVVVGYVDERTDELLAFARVLTDGIYKALVLDVIVSEDERGSGLGRRLMDAVISHPELSDVTDFELYCLEELVPFYEQWEFTNDLGKLRLMRR